MDDDIEVSGDERSHLYEENDKPNGASDSPIIAEPQGSYGTLLDK